MLLNNMDTTDNTNTNTNAAFWLPTHFLTDDDLFDPFAPAPAGPLDSPLSSTDSTNDINNDDHLLSELTRQLAESTLLDSPSNTNTNLTEKPWLFSTSPQSTLAGFGPWSNRSGFTSNGSPNGPSQVPSPPLTPPGAGVAKNDAAWELLYEAAGQVARLKINALAAQMNHHQQHNRGLLSAPRHPSLYDLHPTSQFQQVKRQGREEWFCQQHHHSHQQPRRSCGGGGALGLPQTAWPPLRTEQPHHLHNQRQQGVGPTGSNMRAVFLGPGSRPSPPVKRQSTGTGVFLPRRVGTNHHHQQPEPRKKPTGCSTVLLPARVVQALNLDLEEMNNTNGSNRNSHSRYGSAFITEHEILMARRNALLGQQQRRSLRPDGHGPAPTMVGHDIRLPSDWTY